MHILFSPFFLICMCKGFSPFFHKLAFFIKTYVLHWGGRKIYNNRLERSLIENANTDVTPTYTGKEGYQRGLKCKKRAKMNDIVIYG